MWRYGEYGKMHDDDDDICDYITSFKIPILNITIYYFKE